MRNTHRPDERLGERERDGRRTAGMKRPGKESAKVGRERERIVAVHEETEKERQKERRRKRKREKDRECVYVCMCVAERRMTLWGNLGATSMYHRTRRK